MSLMTRTLVGIAALSLLCTPAAVRADIYRFVDAAGVEHYTNIQPSAHRWQRIYRGKRSKRRATGSGAIREPDQGRLTRHDAHIREAARLYQLPESFLRAVIRVESNFYADAISHKGAMGLMQLMPETAASMGVLDPFDPRQNVLGGARFLRVLANRFRGDLVLTVAAYNAGQGAVERYRGVPPYAETRRYVERVLRHYYAFRTAMATPPGGALAER